MISLGGESLTESKYVHHESEKKHLNCLHELTATVLAPTVLFLCVFVTLTWFGAFGHRAVVHLILKLRSVVVHVDHIDVQVDWILNLVAVHVHCVGSQLRIYIKAQRKDH